MGKPENAVEGYLVQKCEEAGLLCYKFVSPGRRGVPDRIVIGKGRTVFIETKAPNGRPSPVQKLMNKRLLEHGADARFICDRPAVDAFIEETRTWQQNGAPPQRGPSAEKLHQRKEKPPCPRKSTPRT